MYNRYVPQSDGSHKRRSCQEPQIPPRQRPQEPPEPPCPVSAQHPAQTPVRSQKPAHAMPHSNAGSFLRNLIPGDFDTGDLMILLLLLLMAGDCEEERNWAWLTLALYLFL